MRAISLVGIRLPQGGRAGWVTTVAEVVRYAAGMAAKGKTASIGATATPDVELDRLEPYGDDWVQPGFALEYVELGAATPLSGAIAGSGTFSQMLMNAAELAETKLRGVSLRDVIGRNVNAANSDWTAARMNRVVFERSSFTGMQLRESEIQETTFRECKFDYINFRIAQLRNVTFEGCVFTEADFGGAKLDRVRIDGCRLSRVDLSAAELTRVDLRGSELGVNDAFALRGAIISPTQLIDLAPGLRPRPASPSSTADLQLEAHTQRRAGALGDRLLERARPERVAHPADVGAGILQCHEQLLASHSVPRSQPACRPRRGASVRSEKTLRRMHRAGLQSDWLEVLMDHHARLVEPVEVVFRWYTWTFSPTAAAAHTSCTSRPAAASISVTSRPVQSPPQSATTTRPLTGAPASTSQACTTATPSPGRCGAYGARPGGDDHPVGIECQHRARRLRPCA